VPHSLDDGEKGRAAVDQEFALMLANRSVAQKLDVINETDLQGKMDYEARQEFNRETNAWSSGTIEPEEGVTTHQLGANLVKAVDDPSSPFRPAYQMTQDKLSDIMGDEKFITVYRGYPMAANGDQKITAAEKEGVTSYNLDDHGGASSWTTSIGRAKDFAEMGTGPESRLAGHVVAAVVPREDILSTFLSNPYWVSNMKVEREVIVRHDKPIQVKILKESDWRETGKGANELPTIVEDEDELTFADLRDFEDDDEDDEKSPGLLLIQIKGMKYSEDQPRDEHGRWSGGGGTAVAEPPAKIEYGGGHLFKPDEWKPDEVLHPRWEMTIFVHQSGEVTAGPGRMNHAAMIDRVGKPPEYEDQGVHMLWSPPSREAGRPGMLEVVPRDTEGGQLSERSTNIISDFLDTLSSRGANPNIRVNVEWGPKSTLGELTGKKGAFRELLVKYSEDQPRDERGRWSGGGGTAVAERPSEDPKPVVHIPTRFGFEEGTEVHEYQDGKWTAGSFRNDMSRMGRDYQYFVVDGDGTVLTGYVTHAAMVEFSGRPSRYEDQAVHGVMGINQDGSMYYSMLSRSAHQGGVEHELEVFGNFLVMLAERGGSPTDKVTLRAGEPSQTLGELTGKKSVRDVIALLKLKYSPDQPRDERGRWSGGGGAFPTEEPMPSGLRGGVRLPSAVDQGALGAGTPEMLAAAGYSESEAKLIISRQEQVSTYAEEFGFPGDKIIYVHSEGGKFDVGSKKNNSEAGHYDPSTGEVTVYKTAFTYEEMGQSKLGQDTRPMVAHEVFHAKFDAVRKESELELSGATAVDQSVRARIGNRDPVSDGPYGGHQSPMDVGGNMRPEAESQYPTAYGWQQHLEGPPMDQFAKEDGITTYSDSYWRAWSGEHVSFAKGIFTPINETLAEWAAMKAAGRDPMVEARDTIRGRENPPKTFEAAYKFVNEAYDKWAPKGKK
jgi:hypothetical protein